MTTKPKLKRNPVYDATKPTAAELKAVRPYVVDRVIRWSQEGGASNGEPYCEIVEQALTHVFGRSPAAGWRDSEGFDCEGFDINNRGRDGRDEEGYDLEDYDEDGIHRETRRTVDGFDRYGYDLFGFNKDGFDSRGWHRNGVERMLASMTPEQKRDMKLALADMPTDF